MQVALKMMDAKGVGTLRKADVQGIIEKAPIFLGLQQHLQAVLPLCTSITSSAPIQSSRAAHESPLITDFTMNTGQSIKLGETVGQKAAREMSVTELAKLVSERLSPPIPKKTVKKPESIIQVPEARQNNGSRYVVCSDRAMPWLRIDSDERAVFVQSTGVQTDIYFDERPSETQRLQEEVCTLKQLVATLLQHREF
jgi:hypothetical protein